MSGLRRTTKTLLLLCLSWTWALGAQADMPQTFSNEYRTRIMGIGITVTHELTLNPDGTQQLLFLAKSWVGSIEERTLFEWDKEGQVRPLEYSYKRRGLGRNRESALRFDWVKGKVTNKQGETWTPDTTQGVQDKISYQIQLQKDIMEGRKDLSYAIAENDHLRTYRFEVLGEEKLDTPMGKVNTVKIKRSREDSDRVTYAWLAKDWDYILVRMQQEEDGDTQTISINKVQLNGKPIKKF